jgi:preprotein translocase subunit SecA
LRESDIRAHMLKVLDDLAVMGVGNYAPEKDQQAWDFEGMKKWFKDIFRGNLTWEEDKFRLMDREALYEALKREIILAYEEKEKALTPEVIRTLERAILLQVVDNLWKDHLLAMDHLKEGIGLQAYGQKDPLIEYKRQGFAMFDELQDRLEEESIRLIFMVQKVDPSENLFPAGPSPKQLKEEHPSFDPKAAIQRAPAPEINAQPMGLMGQNAPPSGEGFPMGGQPWENPQGQPREAVKVIPIKRDEPKVGRNDPCPCGSGKKYKKCHGA